MMNNLKDLLVHEIKDLHSAETQLLRALPNMEAAATDKNLRKAFSDHLAETESHLQRLNDAANRLGIDPTGETCEAMEGLIREGEEIIAAHGDATVKDAALIGAAQRVEHYEIAAYGTASCYARYLDQDDVAGLLGTTLEEEHNADTKLNKIATGGLLSSGLNKDASER